MDTLTASSVSSRPWVLQFFRNLFGSSRHVTQEGQRPKAKDKDSVRSELLDSPPLDDGLEATLSGKEPDATETSPSEIRKGLMGSCPEELSQLKEISLGDTTPTNENNLPTLFTSTGMEMGDSDGFADPMISGLAQDPCEKAPVTGEKEEESDDRGMEGKDEFPQVLCADDGVAMSSESMTDVIGCSAEEEREHLLKEDAQVEPPKADLSPWNRLLNMYKQRRRLPSSKVDISVQPVIEDEATLDLMIYGIATPRPHVTLSNSSAVASACGKQLILSQLGNPPFGRMQAPHISSLRMKMEKWLMNVRRNSEAQEEMMLDVWSTLRMCTEETLSESLGVCQLHASPLCLLEGRWSTNLYL